MAIRAGAAKGCGALAGCTREREGISNELGLLAANAGAGVRTDATSCGTLPRAAGLRRGANSARTGGCVAAAAHDGLARFMLMQWGVESIWFGSASDVGALLDGPRP